MKLTLMSVILLITNIAHANFSHAPKSFKTKDGQAIFSDFQKADYNISYNPQTKKASARSIITFQITESGMPLFDLVPTPTNILIDGESVVTNTIKSIDSETTYRIILKTLSPGLHTMEINSPINEGVSFSDIGVSSAFWFNDLDDRQLLESYLPSNLEFDQYKMTFHLDFQTLSNQKIYTNGITTKLENNQFVIEFPETYTSSSLYFHTAPIGRYPEKSFIFPSINGRNIPVIAYASSTSSNMETIKKSILKSLEGLEAQYGPFLHNTVTVFIAGSGGMEYCGATMTSLSALNHELTHSYFARGGFMPANGNAGWLDEAITSWSDEGATSRPDISGVISNMAGNSEYRRYTHGDAYTYGKAFMAHLNYKFQSNGGLAAFLNQLILTDAFNPMTTEEFIRKISSFYSEDLSSLFKKHTYTRGVNGPDSQRPVHMKMTIKEMQEFL
jgi:archaellum component FlaG (FlaF/FlaG flagellin family)